MYFCSFFPKMIDCFSMLIMNIRRYAQITQRYTVCTVCSLTCRINHGICQIKETETNICYKLLTDVLFLLDMNEYLIFQATSGVNGECIIFIWWNDQQNTWLFFLLLTQLLLKLSRNFPIVYYIDLLCCEKYHNCTVKT